MSAHVPPADVDDLVHELVATPSANPGTWPGGHGERAVAELCVAWLAGHGVAARTVPVPGLPGRPGVVAETGTGRPPVLLLVGHLDTVRWQVPRREPGVVRGAGAADMKGGVAAVLVALARGVAAGTLRALLVPDAEHESRGVRALAPTLAWEAAVVAEDTGVRPGVAHGGSVTAFVPPAEARARLTRVRPDHARRLRVTSWGEVVRLRLPVAPREDAAALAQHLPDDGWVVREPFAAPDDGALVRALDAAAGAGLDPRPLRLRGWTEAGVLAATGRPCVVLGPGGGGAHTADEWVSLPQVHAAADVLHAVAVTFCAAPSRPPR